MKKPRLCPSEAEVYSAIKALGRVGVVRRQLEVLCNRRSGSIRARVDSLAAKGLIETCGRMIDPVTGRSAEMVRAKK